jgi:hypothetical protein
VQSLGRRLRARRVASRRVASSVVKVVTSSRRRVVASRGMASTIERVGRARAPVRKTILTHPDDDADALALGCAVHGASRRAQDANGTRAFEIAD